MHTDLEWGMVLFPKETLSLWNTLMPLGQIHLIVGMLSPSIMSDSLRPLGL